MLKIEIILNLLMETFQPLQTVSSSLDIMIFCDAQCPKHSGLKGLRNYSVFHGQGHNLQYTTNSIRFIVIVKKWIDALGPEVKC